MMYKDTIELVGYEIYKDDLLQEKKREVKTTVFCDKKSVSQNEFFTAGQIGLKPQYVFIIRLADYKFQDTLIYNNAKYAIYRSYEKGEFIELYTQRKIGV